MQYGNLNYFWLLSLAPLLALGYVLAFRWKRRALARFASVELHEKILQGVSKRKQRLKAAFVVLAVAFLVFALIEPKWGYHWEEVHRRGIDIVIALDVSRSMLADDVKPNRLEAAKREIKDLLNIVKGDRIGLVAFAGTAFIQCPLTLDYGACRLFLDDLSPATIPVGGTAIGEAILKSCQAFESKLKKHKAIILITDGEDHEGNPLEAAKEAKKQGVVVFPIGAGTREGSYIWVEDERGNRVRLKARDGEIVKSHLD
ncbi:MAG: VWA domain-containing protein, partial [Planctomycetes bacterium]|nr:VWA domain-containing protein [Planctomycetota bacterium]